MLDTALELAVIMHSEQVDKGGHPYILHPIRVMLALQSEDEELQAIALLHDSLEDSLEIHSSSMKQTLHTSWPEASVDRVLGTVELLTRKNGQSYNQYIDAMKNNKDALLVKLADLRDNSDVSRIPNPTIEDRKRFQKYQKAIKRVEKHLQNLEVGLE